MADVQDVETSVGETELEPVLPPGARQLNGVLPGHDLVLKGLQTAAAQAQHFISEFGLSDGCGATFPDDHPGCEIRQARRLG